MDPEKLISGVKILARAVGEYMREEQRELRKRDIEMKGTRD